VCVCVCVCVCAAHPLSQLAGGPEVDDLDGRPLGVTQQDVLWFQVAVDD